MAVNLAFGERVRHLRRGRSLAEFGALIKVTPKAVQNYERGRVPRADILARIARIAGSTSEALLSSRAMADVDRVAEREDPYGHLDRSDRRIVDDVADLVSEADEQIKRHLKSQIDLLRRASKTPKSGTDR